MRRYGHFADAEEAVQDALSAGAAIPLIMRAVGGLTTREIAARFLVPETGMAQQISRTKAKTTATTEGFSLPPPELRGDRLGSVLHALYLMYNEGFATSAGGRPGPRQALG